MAIFVFKEIISVDEKLVIKLLAMHRLRNFQLATTLVYIFSYFKKTLGQDHSVLMLDLHTILPCLFH